MGVSDKIGQIVLYIVRHCEVDEDKDQTIRGLLNPSLNDKGRKDAEGLARWFGEIPLAFIATDDLARTQETAEPLGASKQIKVDVDPNLRSWDVGSELEGKSIEANRGTIARLKTHTQLVPVGGQSWGEYETQSIRSFHRYYERALDAIHAGSLIVHGSYVQVICQHLGYSEKDLAYDSTPIKPGGVIAVYLTREGTTMGILKGKKPDADE